MSDTIPFADFAKIDLRVGRVLEASIPEGSEKLVKLIVDFAEESPRTIFTGLQTWYDSAYFQDRSFIFVYNLEPRKMMNEDSQGMLLSVHVEDDEKPTDSKPLPVEAPLGSNPGQKLT